jgi:3-deoxy-D-manno-octulosonate 8-phosphate phosphatase (KDO 8-P phosphatase)
MSNLATKPLPSLLNIHTVAFDFDGIFTDNKVWVDQDGRESVRCDRGDGLAFDLVRAFKRLGRLDADFFILSKEANPVVLARARKLKLDCRHGVADKLGFMTNYLAGRSLGNVDPFAGLVYLGNDLNDLLLMRRSGFSVAPADAHPLVCSAADLVMPQRGGEGFVRSFIELLLGISQLSTKEIDELICDR